MAEASKGRKSRIRKSAPTIRELTQVPAKDKSETKRTFRSRIGGVITWPFRKLMRSNNFIARAVRKVLRPFLWLLRKLVPSYFINSWREMKLVTWPGRKETWRLTGAVFVFAIVFGVAIYFVDMGLDKLFRKLVID